MTMAPRVALLESRMSHEVARLVERHGGQPVCVPTVREAAGLAPEAAERLIGRLAGGEYGVVIFMTGVAVSMLFELAERLGRRPALVTALRAVTTVCRGPKPTAALRGFGVVPTLSASESFTSAEVIDALSGLELADQRVLLFHYGERSDALAETLLARRVVLDEEWLYRWELPDDVTPMEELVVGIVRGEVDALAVTCQIQFRHLYQVAERLKLDAALVESLNEKVVVAVVGPMCHALLRSRGVDVHVMPEHPKMGPLIVSLMRHLEQRAGRRDLATARAH